MAALGTASASLAGTRAPKARTYPSWALSARLAGFVAQTGGVGTPQPENRFWGILERFRGRGEKWQQLWLGMEQRITER
jgi:hypothetical protein